MKADAVADAGGDEKLTFKFVWPYVYEVMYDSIPVIRSMFVKASWPLS